MKLANRALAVALVLGACSSAAPTAQPAPAAQPAPTPAAAAADAARARRIDAVIDRVLAERRLVGGIVLVAHEGRVVYVRAAGHADREAARPVTEDTVFRLASMTKPIVSAAALALVEKGALRLDDPVARWLPELQLRTADGAAAPVTVKHLLTHTSGLGYAFFEPAGGPYRRAGVSDGLAEPGRTFADNAKRLSTVALHEAPGTRWRYGLSVDILGEVVARAGGAELPAVVGRLITEPLGMRDTHFHLTPALVARLAVPYGDKIPPERMTDPYTLPFGDGNQLSVTFAPSRILDRASFPSGGAGLAGTARDYLRFAEALRTGGAPILRRETVQMMTADQIGELPGGQAGWRFGYGVGVLVDPAVAKSPLGRGSFLWSGIYGSHFWIDPSAGLSVVILTNVAGPALDPFTGELERAVYGT